MATLVRWHIGIREAFRCYVNGTSSHRSADIVDHRAACWQFEGLRLACTPAGLRLACRFSDLLRLARAQLTTTVKASIHAGFTMALAI